MNTTSLRILALALLALSPFAAQAHGESCARPFQYAGTVPLQQNFAGAIGTFLVPAGYRLQIEQVSASIRLGASTDRADFQIGTTAGGAFGYHDLPTAEGYATIDRKTYGPVTLYADLGSAVRIAVSRVTTGYPPVTARYTVTGCLFPA